MLKELYVSDFAIIDAARMEFGPGFNAFTGETGAGKSIVIEALQLALGGRSSEEMIRASAEKAVVEAVFGINGAPGLAPWLEENGFSCEGDLVVRRIVSRGGKNRTFINGASATVAQARAAGAMLVDIHGQHDSQSILDSSFHIMILDKFLGLGPLRQEYGQKRALYLEAAERLAAAQTGKEERERRIDFLRHQTEEISLADLQPGEDAHLAAEKRILSNAEKLRDSLAEILARVDESEGSSASGLHKSLAAMEKLVAIDENLAPVKTAMEGALFQLEDAAGNIRNYLGGIDMDPSRLAEVDDRLDLIRQLKRKYGETVEKVLEFRQNAQRELEELLFMRDNLDKLRDLAEKARAEAARLAANLDRERKKGAPSLAAAVGAQLRSLNMERAEFSAGFSTSGGDEKLGPDGIGTMEFLFSANPGEPQKPLVKIASGGEISRLMLAIKTVLPGDQPAPVMVFDEIDSGMGGATADTLGKKMKELAKNCQVFCVTHLPQVARHADCHIRISKRTEKGRAKVEAKRLSDHEKVEELARMAGGVGDSQAAQAALKWAREALDDARKS
ncbi:MAG: DNA repair protein RecN [Nitrospinota bacterium]|nr:DNA repair protein RecN [Nitrospinota bacterium]